MLIKESKILKNNLEDLLMQIEINTGNFPEDQLKELIERKDEAIPLLINILKDVPNNLDKYLQPTAFIHIYAAYLLAQFRCKEAFPLFIEIMKLQGETPHDLYGDAITEDAGRIMTSLYNGDISAIKEIIESEKVDEYVRGQGIYCLVNLAINDILDRSIVIEYMTQLLNGRLQDRNPDVLGSIIIALDDLYPEESYEAIKKVFEVDEVDEFLVCLDDIKTTLEKTKEDVLNAARKNPHRKLIYDTIDELSGWAAFNEHAVDYSSNGLKKAAIAQNKKKKKEKAKRKSVKKQKKKNRKK